MFRYVPRRDCRLGASYWRRMNVGHSTPAMTHSPCSACEHYRGPEQSAALCAIGPLRALPEDGCAFWTARIERAGMRLLVCGGRDFADKAAAWRALDAAHARRPIGLLIHGGARGADELAGAWAEARDVPAHAYAAMWKAYGPAAGPMRNQRMLETARPDGVLALPGGRGTADMCTRAAMAGLPIWRPFG